MKPAPMIVVNYQGVSKQNDYLRIGKEGQITIASDIKKSSQPRLRVSRARIQIRVTVETRATTTRAQHDDRIAHPLSTSPLSGTAKVSAFMIKNYMR